MLTSDRDITERRQSEEALKGGEQKYLQLAETLHDGILVIDKRAYITFVDPRTAEMLGYTVDEMLGKRLFSLTDEGGVKVLKHRLESRREDIKEL
jgi:PAS domain S-box-containing protein